MLLISSNFLASDYCYDTETIRALEKHQLNESVVIPIILSPCLWLESKLKDLQSLPRDNKPVSTFENKDVAWLEVAHGILDEVKKIHSGKIKSISVLNKPRRQSEVEYNCNKILEFLKNFDKWYFSPLRIQKWGGRQPGFSELAGYSTKEIKECLEGYKIEGLITTTKSQKGNIIYKYIS